MDISALSGFKGIFDDIGNWWDDLTGLAGAYIESGKNIVEFLGILGRFANGDFSDLSAESSLAGSLSGSSE